MNRKLTVMYLFDLNMPDLRSEAFAQECFKRKVFLNILLNSLENKYVEETLL